MCRRRLPADALQTSEFLKDLGETQLSMLASAGKRRRHKRYVHLYREGSPATCFYVLKSGTLHETAVGGGARTLHVPRRADAPFVLFGMEALLGRARAATVSCLDDAEVLWRRVGVEDVHARRRAARPKERRREHKSGAQRRRETMSA